MAGDDQEKTEEPTSKKIEDARKEGNVPKSPDLAGFFGIFVAFLTYLALFGFLKEKTALMFKHITSFYGQELSIKFITNLTIDLVLEVALLVVVFGIPIMLAGVIGNLVQFGFLFTTKPLTPDLKKIDPIKGTKNLFSMKKLIEGVKITLKVGVSFTVGFVFFWMFIQELPTVALFPLMEQFDWLKEKIIILVGVMLIVMLVFGVVDFVIKKVQHTKDLKMSQQEVKDEYKNMEGDPMIKQKIRQIQMKMARQRMLSDVPMSDVVVTNPTHYSVAIKYDPSGGIDAPMVVAKGVDKLAFKIREIAKEHDIEIYEAPPIARELYKSVEIGEPIPEKLYQAVAEILAFVYKSNKKL